MTMNKLRSLLLITFTMLFVITSCSDKDGPIIEKEKGDLISASFNPATKKFTLNYSKGSSETVDAVIDNTVNPPTAKAKLKDGTIIWVSDATKDGIATIGPIPPSEDNVKYVNDWIFEEMNIYYLWNDKIPKNPDFTLSPDLFFKSLLNTYDKNTNPQGDRFSWIQEDYTDLLGSLGGVSSDEIGFEFTFVWADQAKTHYYALVTYPKLGSDAHAKGVKRGRFVVAVDGKDITSSWCNGKFKS